MNFGVVFEDAPIARSYAVLAAYYIGASELVGHALGHGLLGLFFALGTIWLAARPERPVGRVVDLIAEDPPRWAAKIGATGILAGGLSFAAIEHARILDGIWWAFISMTTVGYGDVSPKTPEVRIVAVAMILIGLVVTAIIIGEVAAAINDVRRRRYFERADDTPELDDDLDQLSHTVAQAMDELKVRMSHPYVVAALKRCHEEQQSRR
jgi:hypothetical protein